MTERVLVVVHSISLSTAKVEYIVVVNNCTQVV